MTNSPFSDLQPEIYGFAIGSVGRILYQLKATSCSYLVFPNNLDHYLTMLLHDQSPYILGLGSCSDINQHYMGIETICSNKLKSKFINLEIKPFLEPNSQMRYTHTIGDSFCSMASWKIMQLIKQQELKSQFSFLHVPKSIPFWSVTQKLDQTLLEFKSDPR